jgi:hypothetical protein
MVSAGGAPFPVEWCGVCPGRRGRCADPSGAPGRCRQPVLQVFRNRSSDWPVSGTTAEPRGTAAFSLSPVVISSQFHSPSTGY